MQADLNRKDWPVDVQILGVNRAGREDGNDETCADRTIPWLQDTAAQNVWGRWNAAYNDIVILDAKNVHVATFNLTDRSLAYSWNYDALMAKLRDAAYSR